MKNISKTQTRKLVKNAIAHVADGFDDNKVVTLAKVEEKIEPKVEIMEEKIEPKVVTLAKVEEKIEPKVEIMKENVTKAVEKSESMIGKAHVDNGNYGFDRPKVEPGIHVVCNINGINVGDECKIECAPNPKRPGSKAHMRYEQYSKATTIKEYLDNGGLKADLRYDHSKGYLTVLEVIREGKKVTVETV